MSTIHINQIQGRIISLQEHIDLSDISERDPERETKIKSRCLAAYAVLNTIDCSEDEAGQSVVDGGDDNGIDAIYYSENHKKW